MLKIKPRPRAYSYLRFSTSDQIKGDSLRRQLAASELYAERENLDLDKNLTFEDKGVSAFKGKNASDGKLGAFIRAVESGKIEEGSFLLVENIDRLSRETVRKAFSQFNRILDLGINIVTLMDNKVYTKRSMDENVTDLFFSIMSMFRAHEESATKSKRLKSAWNEKHRKARENKTPVTSRCPAWLRLNKETGQFEVIEERANIVRRIYQMHIDGYGNSVITRTLNRERISTIGRSSTWHGSYIQRILTTQAVIGSYQPRHGGKELTENERLIAGKPIKDYYPAIISPEMFHKVTESRKKIKNNDSVRILL